MSLTILDLRKEWRGLRAPELAAVTGDWEASFVTPLRHLAPAGLGLIGLPKWYGKRLRLDDGRIKGVNLLRTDQGLGETLPMEVSLGLSLTDDLPAIVVTYVPGSRKPWPWVRDELRLRQDGSLLGMTYVDLPGVRALGGTPFVLDRQG